MADDGPPLVRPIPRRPFNFTTTPLPDDTAETEEDYRNPNADLSASRFLNTGFPSVSDAASSISRPPSFMNLTSSTLFGIYSPTTSRAFGDKEEDDTPWGTGAQTPIKRPSVDEVTYKLMKERSHLNRRRSSFRSMDTTLPHSQPSSSVSSTILRVTLLFGLGVGYGMLLSRFQDSTQWPSLPEGIAIQTGYKLHYLAFWGVTGVALGTLLPWFDHVWEDTFKGEEEDTELEKEGAVSHDESDSTDWALVMRAIGAFVGIIFAIRKLAWASTLQVSVALALVNPLLWWLIDRSTPGFILSTVVGFTGSAILLGINPEIIPAPSSLLHHALTNGHHNNASSSSSDAIDGHLSSTLGGLASHETLETGVWLLSVLFCSCVCFGNIGRRLAWDKTAGVKGRWGGLR